MTTKSKIRKWGNSLAIRIPGAVAKELGLSDSSEVQITSDGSSVTIKPKKTKKITLDELLKGVTPKDVHGEFDWGPDVGAERWYDEE